MAAFMRPCFFFIYLVLLPVNVVTSSAHISDKRKCSDEDCEDTISYAKAIVKHAKNDPIFLSFEVGENIKVKSKEAGERRDLWGGETFDGRTGYFPKVYVKEYEVEDDNPEYVVPTKKMDISSKLANVDVADKRQDKTNMDAADTTETDEPDVDDTEIDAVNENGVKNNAKETEDIKIEEPLAKPDDETEILDDTEVDDSANADDKIDIQSVGESDTRQAGQDKPEEKDDQPVLNQRDSEKQDTSTLNGGEVDKKGDISEPTTEVVDETDIDVDEEENNEKENNENGNTAGSDEKQDETELPEDTESKEKADDPYLSLRGLDPDLFGIHDLPNENVNRDDTSDLNQFLNSKFGSEKHDDASLKTNEVPPDIRQKQQLHENDDSQKEPAQSTEDSTGEGVKKDEDSQFDPTELKEESTAAEGVAQQDSFSKESTPEVDKGPSGQPSADAKEKLKLETEKQEFIAEKPVLTDNKQSQPPPPQQDGSMPPKLPADSDQKEQHASPVNLTPANMATQNADTRQQSEAVKKAESQGDQEQNKERLDPDVHESNLLQQQSDTEKNEGAKRQSETGKVPVTGEASHSQHGNVQQKSAQENKDEKQKQISEKIAKSTADPVKQDKEIPLQDSNSLKDSAGVPEKQPGLMFESEGRPEHEQEDRGKKAGVVEMKQTHTDMPPPPVKAVKGRPQEQVADTPLEQGGVKIVPTYTASTKSTAKPVDIHFTPLAVENVGLKSSMAINEVSVSVETTPSIDHNLPSKNSVPPISTDNRAETVHARETVIDGTTIPYDDDYQDWETASRNDQLNPSETQSMLHTPHIVESTPKVSADNLGGSGIDSHQRVNTSGQNQQPPEMSIKPTTEPVVDMYKSEEFLNRKPLSVGSGSPSQPSGSDAHKDPIRAKQPADAVQQGHQAGSPQQQQQVQNMAQEAMRQLQEHKQEMLQQQKRVEQQEDRRKQEQNMYLEQQQHQERLKQERKKQEELKLQQERMKQELKKQQERLKEEELKKEQDRVRQDELRKKEQDRVRQNELLKEQERKLEELKKEEERRKQELKMEEEKLEEQKAEHERMKQEELKMQQKQDEVTSQPRESVQEESNQHVPDTKTVPTSSDLRGDSNVEVNQQGDTVVPDSQEPDSSSEESPSSSFTVTPPSDGDPEIPAPPLDTTTPGQQQAVEGGGSDQTQSAEGAGVGELSGTADPYETESQLTRKINDENLSDDQPASAGYFMKTVEENTRLFIHLLPPSVQSLLEQEPLGLSPHISILVTMATLIVMVTMAVCSCMCQSGRKTPSKKDPLVVIQELEEKLFVATKEKENLEDVLQDKHSEMLQMEKDVKKRLTKFNSLETDLQNYKLHNEALKQQLSESDNQAAHFQQQLAESVDGHKASDRKMKDLSKQLSKLEEKYKKTEQELHKKTSSLKEESEEVSSLVSQVHSLGEQVKMLETSKEQLLAEAEDWKDRVHEMKERLDEMEAEYKHMQETVAFKDNELEVMKDCFLQLKVFEPKDGENDEEFMKENQAQIEEKIQAMIDVSKVNARLRAAEEESSTLDNKLHIELEARKEVEDQLERARRDLEMMQTDKMKAERQNQEAQTKLNVLSNYFKEKEMQMQRELGEQEALKKQNINKLVNADEYTKMIEQEVELYKSQAESLKREISASERDFRSQIAANEKKAHENWLTARAAERELKECRHELGVLRQKLTDVERRQMDGMGPPGLIRPLPTRGLPPLGMMNGPPPPGMDIGPLPPGRDMGPSPPGMDMGPPPPGRDLGPPPPGRDLGPLPPLGRDLGPPPPGRDMGPLPPGRDLGPPPPPGMERSPSRHNMPPLPHMRDGEFRGSPHPERLPPPPFDRRLPPHPLDRTPPHPMDRRTPPHLLDRRTPPFRPPPPDMMPRPRGPPIPFGPEGPGSPRVPLPMDPRLGPRNASPNVQNLPPSRDNRHPRQHSQV